MTKTKETPLDTVIAMYESALEYVPNATEQ